MSEFTDILTGRVQLKRLTADLLELAAVAASMTLDRQPPQACRLRVEIAGATINSGSVAIAGSTTETISFSENCIKINTKDFSSISSITVDGISDGFIRIKAVSKTGQPVNQEIEVYSSLSVRFYTQSGKIRMMAVGQNKVAEYKMMTEAGKDIQENDFVYALSGIAGLTRGQVSFVEQITDFDGLTCHIEAEIMKL